MNVTDKIIERVQKLLALAGGNTNENEASAAVAKAHAILAEHNLSMQQVEAHDASTGGEGDERGALNTETKFFEKQWKWIWNTVAEANYCSMFSVRLPGEGRTTTYTVVGRKVNAVVASQLAMYLCVTVRRLANEAAKEAGRKDWAYKNAFITGCALRLCQRIKEQNETEATAPSGGALVLWTGKEQEKNAAFIKESLGLSLTVSKARRGRYDAAGLQAGRKAGDNVSLAQQVASGEAAKRIG